MRSKKALAETPLTVAILSVNPKSADRRREIRLAEQAERKREASTPITPPSDPHELLRPVDQIPNPWLFDSEALLRELDRCRELVLRVPAPSHEIHFAVNTAVTAIWDLQVHLRFLLHLHREGQRAFAKKADVNQPATPKTISRRLLRK